MSDRVATRARGAARGRAWLVGGAVRDRLLGRPTPDVDLVVDGDVARGRAALARAGGGRRSSSRTSSARGACMAARPRLAGRRQPAAGRVAGRDLALRDFTVNAMAEPLRRRRARRPARRRRRPRGAAPADGRPARVRRRPAARRCGSRASPASWARASTRRRRAGARAGARARRRRARARLRRAQADHRAPTASSRRSRCMDALGLTARPARAPALRGVEQNRYHHLDVHDHTLEVLAEAVALSATRRGARRPSTPQRCRALLAEPLADELTRGTALRFGALLHDIAKPATLAVRDDGSSAFLGHDRGAPDDARHPRAPAHQRAAAAHTSPRWPATTCASASSSTSGRWTRRAIYRYLAPATPSRSTSRCCRSPTAWRPAGARPTRRSRKHLELAREVLPAALAWHAEGRRAPLVRGDELARALGIAPGPRLGELLPRSPRRATPARSRRASRRSRSAQRLLGFSKRLAFSAMRDPDCIFCQIVAGELPATIVDRGRATIVFMDIHPAPRGHALVIPRAHSDRRPGDRAEDLRAVAIVAQRVAARAKRRSEPTASTCSTPRRRGLADRLSFPHSRHPSLRAIPCTCRGAAPGGMDDIAAASAELGHDAGPPRSRRAAGRHHARRAAAEPPSTQALIDGLRTAIDAVAVATHPRGSASSQAEGRVVSAVGVDVHRGGVFSTASTPDDGAPRSGMTCSAN